MPHHLAEAGKPYRFDTDKARYAARMRWHAESKRIETGNGNTPPSPIADPFPVRLLARTRTRINSLMDAMTAETDPAKIDRLASALARLAELERQLAGRPLPGSLRPSQRKVDRPVLDVSPLPETGEA